MVKIILTIVIAHLFLVSLCQEKDFDKKIELNASVNTDSIDMEDTLEVNLIFKNVSNSYISFYPNAIIGMIHDHKEFITYDNQEKIAYKLHDKCNYDSVFALKPGQGLKYIYRIKASENFFNEGANNILFFYHLYEMPLNKGKQKVYKKKAILSLWSSPIEIYISSQDRSLKKCSKSGH